MVFFKKNRKIKNLRRQFFNFLKRLKKGLKKVIIKANSKFCFLQNKNLTNKKIPKLIILAIFLKLFFSFFFSNFLVFWKIKMDLWEKEKNTLKWDNEKKEYFEGNLKKLVENKVKELDLTCKVFNSFLLLFLEISFSLSFFERVSLF